jgi:hypothetical protein
MKRSAKSLLTTLNLPAMLMVVLTTPSIGGEITSDVAPPPARVERFEPRDGYIWAPGYWEWQGTAYHWVSGTYLLEHRGARWVADRWEPAGPHWQRVAGHWSTEARASLAARGANPGAAH